MMESVYPNKSLLSSLGVEVWVIFFEFGRRKLQFTLWCNMVLEMKHVYNLLHIHHNLSKGDGNGRGAFAILSLARLHILSYANTVSPEGLPRVLASDNSH